MSSSLWGIYETLSNADQRLSEKIAAEAAPSREVAEETAKLAQDYDEAGRRLARAHWSQFVKEAEGAFPFAGKETPEEEEKERAEAEKKKHEGKKAEEKSDEERVEEKKASIAQRLMQDPAYRAELLAKYHQG